MKKIRMPKQMGWLVPGLQVKRWFALILVGTILMTFGILILFDIRPVYYTMKFISKIANTVSTEWLAFGIIMIGVAFFFKGWRMTNLSMLGMKDSRQNDILLENLYRRRKLNRGPRIVAIGGGTGLSMLLSGIKNITNNITAVVTVGDDGGSSGRLRESMGILPPGDIRHCITALADDEDLITKLFKYRFDNGEGLEGHSFGNLFLTALCDITGNMVSAVKASANVISIRGRVLPSTLDDMKLVAEMENGRIVHGESNIPEARGKIKRLYTEPENCKALPEVLQAIHSAELIILGPGSLYTSVIPNLLIKEISEAVSKSSAKKIYVCNIMTQPGETDGYTVSDHLKALIRHAGVEHLLDAVLVNNNIPKDWSGKYKEKGQYPVKTDTPEIKKLGISICAKNLVDINKDGFIRHNSSKVARAVYYWFRKSK
ncbi:MAG: gluconeogenesis factor YvcK family protein [Cyanobacteriota bacterium]|nr:gluconeogenesis factor YvcK family protein [Cyanobacteriota bacterium]MDY6364991.1 gluconeogenesis factor YvcK family protein [Cyanobacteriota bacterium]MDY6383252.1 gluconeogenesis factor YvcK family protein [Cyanobacteriota bacterium]